MSNHPDSGLRERLLSYRFAITILFSSFLLFQIQPMAARAILPWFGGGAMVWCACMLFFQTLLLCGYLLAHLLFSRLEPSMQGAFFLLLIVIAILTLNVSPERPEDLRTAVETPVWSITLILLQHVGLPYLVLSAVSPLLQGWFGLTYPGRSPYRLYAVSNFGSLAALVSYPFLIEPLFGLSAQVDLWSALFLVFSLSVGLCGTMLISGRHGRPVESDLSAERPALYTVVLWISIAALSSLSLLAVTNRLTNEVSVTPVLWILPLSLYLLSFILCFDSDRWYRRSIYMTLFFFFAIFSGATKLGQASRILLEATGSSGLLFSICMVCHGELVRLKPAARHLTGFYLSISFGGALGGLFVALLAPALFDGYFELPMAISLTALLVLAVTWHSWQSQPEDDRLRQAWGGSIGASLVIGAMLATSIYEDRASSIAFSRNFYGVLRVSEEGEAEPAAHRKVLSHGRTVHGAQLVASPAQPISYYSPSSAIGMVFRHTKPDRARRIGVLGLGTGTIAALADGDDYVRFYEIDPDVVAFARTHFSFLEDSSAKIDIILGDARLSLENEESHRFDILVIDTFSGDAMPVHLLTAEAMSVYQRHLADDGVLIVHISSRYYDLRPLLKAFEAPFRMWGGSIDDVLEEGVYLNTRYYLLTRDQALLDVPEISEAIERSNKQHYAPVPAEKIWTDNYSNVIMLLYEAESFRR